MTENNKQARRTPDQISPLIYKDLDEGNISTGLIHFSEFIGHPRIQTALSLPFSEAEKFETYKDLFVRHGFLKAAENAARAGNHAEALLVYAYLVDDAQFYPIEDLDKPFAGEIFNKMAMSLRMQGEHQRAFDFLKKAEKILPYIKNDSLTLETYGNLIDVLRTGDRNKNNNLPFKKNLPEARKYRELARSVIDIHRRQDIESQTTVRDDAFKRAEIKALIQFGLLADAEDLPEQKITALGAYIEAIDMAEKYGDKELYFRAVQIGSNTLTEQGFGNFIHQHLIEAVNYYLQGKSVRSIANAFYSIAAQAEIQNLPYLAAFYYQQALDYANGMYPLPSDRESAVIARQAIQRVSTMQTQESPGGTKQEIMLNAAFQRLKQTGDLIMPQETDYLQVCTLLYEMAKSQMKNAQCYSALHLLFKAYEYGILGNFEETNTRLKRRIEAAQKIATESIDPSID